MRNWLFILFLAVGSFVAKGQVTFPDTVRMTITIADTPDVVVNVPITNPTNAAININWKRTINDYDVNWGGTQVCDLNNCYPVGVSAGPQNSVVAANASGNFQIHFLSSRHVGSGHLQLSIYTPGHDSISTLRNVDVYLTVNNTTGVTVVKPADPESIKVYPNPAKDFVLIQNQQGVELSRVEVYSMLGRKVLTEKLDSQEALTKIDISEMQKGIYMVRVFDSSNNVVVTKSISHIR